ncbi:MAG: glutamate--tRNA ligase [Kiritimatiellaeota bacterium]|nr:glutamate--tRNA ligase [Kiritimatiellota bacterium]
MSIRVRFAPSPTGHVHIGNIRVAIFNWLFARHENGAFLLRIEDTDRERSTPQAIRDLLDVLDWLGLEPDEPPLYQSARARAHREAAERLLDEGKAYRSAKGGQGEAVLFRIPWEIAAVPGVRRVGPVEWPVHPDRPVDIDAGGIRFARISKKGKPVPFAGCLAGFRDLEVFDSAGALRVRIEDWAGEILDGGKTVSVDRPGRIRFTRHEVGFHDLVKGALAKPVDSMRDLVVVRSDGAAVFHLANVCDDVFQQVTHIIRGDDHVENTYRHVLLYHALGRTPPAYAHLPMIVNAAGKPYSKRDGDAYAGDFRDKGFLPHALFNYLSLLGWSPGDGREAMTREELISSFSLDRVQEAPAQMDPVKLLNLNGRWMAALPFDEFRDTARRYAAECPWGTEVDEKFFGRVARLLQSRTKLYPQVCEWDYFFVDLPEYDPKACRKFLARPGVGPALRRLAERLAESSFTAEDIERLIHETTAEFEIPRGKLNQPLRVALTGRTVGAGIYETAELLGRERAMRRLEYALAEFCTAG